MKSYRDLLFCGMLFLCASANADGLLAFPGACGWGRYATGGRYGSVYHVTNLNDKGTGSLRDAVSQPNRIVVFDVAGVINISSRMTFARNLYIAGQTAPGEGITVYGNGVSFSNSTNTICRYMKFRMGHNGDSGKDAAGIAGGTDMIFDHCSISWGRDETFSINSDGKGDLGRITIMNSIMGQGLLTHSAGGLMQADSITLYRNFYCDNSTRNNKVKGINQYVNNVVYNWSNGAYIMGGDSEGTSYVNVENNLFINGPSKGGAAFTGANERFNVYGNDNWQDNNMNGVYDPFLITDYSASTRVKVPYAYPELDKWPGNELIDRLLPEVGASLPYRDPSDYYMIDEVMSFGTKGALISNEETLSSGSPSTWPLWTGNNVADTDGDGMPDWWELANGTNVNVDDAMTISQNGYANIENYINSITLETVNEHQFYLRRPWAVNVLASSSSSFTVSWSDYTRGEEGFIVEIKEGDSWKEVARTEAGATSCTISDGLLPATTYQLRICAFAGSVKGDYCDELTIKTKPEIAELIDCNNYSADYVWGTKAMDTWNKKNYSWGSDNSLVYSDNSNVLIAPNKNITILLTDTVKPMSVVVNSDYLVKIGYSNTAGNTGSIAGKGSLNKAGNGELRIETTNTYEGPTVIHGGKVTVRTLKDGGVPSGIGASQEFAQNLVLDGGILNYVGGNTSTNRSIQLLDESTIAVETKAYTLSMSGSVEGDANLVIDGAGTVSVKSNKFFIYSGNTILKGGTLYLSSAEIANAGIGKSPKLVMCGGELKTKGDNNGDETYSFPIEVVEGTTSYFSPNERCYIKSKVTGYGNLQVNIPYLREYFYGDWSDFHGRLIANSAYSGGGLLLIQNVTNDFPNNVVELKGNSILCGWQTNMTMEIGGLAGDAQSFVYGSSKKTKGFVASYIVGNANTDETYNGVITNYSCSGSKYTGVVNINKVGTGLWRLTGNNFYNGETKVSGGKLVVNGKHTGTGAVLVLADAVLGGKGTLNGNVTVENGGVIMAGDTLVDNSVLTLNGRCSLKSGSTMALNLKADGTTNYIKANGGLDIEGAVLDVNLEDVEEIENGTLFKVFDASSVTGSGFASITPENPSADQFWDKSRLMSEGVLRVISRDEYVAGINSAIISEDEKAGVFTLGGVRSDKSHKGICIKNGKKQIVR